MLRPVKFAARAPICIRMLNVLLGRNPEIASAYRLKGLDAVGVDFVSEEEFFSCQNSINFLRSMKLSSFRRTEMHLTILSLG